MRIIKLNGGKPIKGQALIFVFFLLLVIGILSVSLAVMLRTEIQTRIQEKNGLIAFYLAQAGVEYGKVQLVYVMGWPGVTDFPFGVGNFTVSVQDISCPPGPYTSCKRVVSQGEVGETTKRVGVDLLLRPLPFTPTSRDWREE